MGRPDYITYLLRNLYAGQEATARIGHGKWTGSSCQIMVALDYNNHDGVITHLKPDILDCEVKWALESITTNKASGGDGIPVELFQILKDNV